MKAQIENTQAKPVSRMVIWLILIYCLLFYGVFLLDRKILAFFTAEDSISETLGTLSLLLSSIFCFILFLKSREGNDFFLFKTKRNIVFLFLALLFFFGAGEELSWGQRIFKFSTPEIIDAENVQKEFNLHNLKIFHNVDFSGNLNNSIFAMTHLFTLFSLTFCLLIPLLDRFSAPVSRFRKRLGIPLVPLRIGSFFGAIYLLSKILKWGVFSSDFNLIAANLEIRESLWSFLFFMIALYWIKELRRPGHSEDHLS